MRTASDGVAVLRAALEAEGGALAEAAAASPAGADPEVDGAAPGPAQVAAAGPRAAGFETEYELLIEMILEGSRLHYGTPRVLAVAEPDLALLLGDQLYALGLARLAALGDLEAVSELADVISLVAQAHAVSDRGLADAVWEAGAVAIGWGSTPEHVSAKARARAGETGADAALRAAARAARSARS